MSIVKNSINFPKSRIDRNCDCEEKFRIIKLILSRSEEEEEEEETLFVNGMYNYIGWVQSSTIKQ